MRKPTRPKKPKNPDSDRRSVRYCFDPENVNPFLNLERLTKIVEEFAEKNDASVADVEITLDEYEDEARDGYYTTRFDGDIMLAVLESEDAFSKRYQKEVADMEAYKKKWAEYKEKYDKWKDKWKALDDKKKEIKRIEKQLAETKALEERLRELKENDR